jgi:hypothetical protein
MSGRWHSRWDGIAHRYHEPRRDFPTLSLVIGAFIVALRGHGCSSVSLAPLRRGARVGLTKIPTSSHFRLQRWPEFSDPLATMHHLCLGKSSAPSQPEVRALDETRSRCVEATSSQFGYSRRPPTTHRSSCRVGLLRIGGAAPIAAPVVEQVVEREIIDGLRLGPRPEVKHSPSLWQSCAINVIFYGATAK